MLLKEINKWLGFKYVSLIIIVSQFIFQAYAITYKKEESSNFKPLLYTSLIYTVISLLLSSLTHLITNPKTSTFDISAPLIIAYSTIIRFFSYSCSISNIFNLTGVLQGALMLSTTFYFDNINKNDLEFNSDFYFDQMINYISKNMRFILYSIALLLNFFTRINIQYILLAIQIIILIDNLIKIYKSGEDQRETYIRAIYSVLNIILIGMSIKYCYLMKEMPSKMSQKLKFS